MIRAALLCAGLAAIAAGAGVTASGADYTASAPSPGNAFAAAADFNTVAVSLSDPGTPLRGTVALAATASSERGVDRVRFQASPAGTGAWTDVCEDASAPYACDWDSAGVADGSHDLRAVAVDQAGYRRGDVVPARLVDNTAPAVTLTDPGSPLRGTVTLNATASDGGGVASVVFERSPAGAGTWTAICTDDAAPYTCSFNTTALGDDEYDIRARATDNAGRSGTSLAGARVLDNDTTPTGTDVQTPVQGETPGRLETGDQISFTFSEPVGPASVLAGWTGAPQAIRVTVANNGNNDRMDFLDSTGATRLNLVRTPTDLQLGSNLVTATTLFDATIARSGDTITVTLGSFISGALATGNGNARMSWRPHGSALDLAGNAVSTTAVAESGAQDRDF